MAEIVERCVGYKARVVEADELDRAERATLNLGHTTAHALEKVLGFGVMGHGFAVALGLLVALAASEEVLGTDPSLRRRTRDLLEALGLVVSLPLPPLDELLGAMSRDKKVSGKGLGFVGLRGLGDPVRDLDLPASVLERALAGDRVMTEVEMRPATGIPPDSRPLLVLLHGVNLDLLGERPAQHYGTVTLSGSWRHWCGKRRPHMGGTARAIRPTMRESSWSWCIATVERPRSWSIPERGPTTATPSTTLWNWRAGPWPRSTCLTWPQESRGGASRWWPMWPPCGWPGKERRGYVEAVRRARGLGEATRGGRRG